VLVDICVVFRCVGVRCVGGLGQVGQISESLEQQQQQVIFQGQVHRERRGSKIFKKRKRRRRNCEVTNQLDI
jgi:hypothetical protein